MPRQLFIAVVLDLTLDDFDRNGNRLLWVFGRGFANKKLNVVTDFQSREQLVARYTCRGKEEFRSMFNRRDESTVLFAMQFRYETVLPRDLAGVART